MKTVMHLLKGRNNMYLFKGAAYKHRHLKEIQACLLEGGAIL